MLGVKELSTGLKVRRLRWFKHVKRREEGEALRRAVGVEIPGCHPPGRPRRAWRQCVEKDLATLATEEAEARDRNRWKYITDCRQETCKVYPQWC